MRIPSTAFATAILTGLLIGCGDTAQKDRTSDELKKAQENAKAGANAEAAASKAAGKKK